MIVDTPTWLTSLIDGLPGGFSFRCRDDQSMTMERLSAGCRDVLGHSAEALIGNQSVAFADLVHPEDRDRLRNQTEAAVSRMRPFQVSYRIVAGGGEIRWLLQHCQPVPGGNPQGMALEGLMLDVTDQHRAEQTLDGDTERQLVQAHKMQAVGELTGGLAHDFNNLLMAVQGNIEFLRDEVAAGSDAERYADSALKAVGRGAELTQRLLAFSRKQLLRPEPTSLNRLVADMSELLTRTLGSHISIVTNLDDDVGHALVDPGQLENALINLAINARDAMQGGGTLTIASARIEVTNGDNARLRVLEPGDYVVMTVADNGSGMTAEVIDRAFEPFFTTKENKKGNGLGLSMVYGFVKQSGGHIEIDSVVGEGTDVSIYLPRAEVRAQDSPELDEELAAVPGGSETVLVVEDDEEVRGIIVSALKGLGYDLRDAASASDARLMLQQGLKPDMVVTDVMQPRGMDGIELAISVRNDLPDCAVLLVSGYSEDVIDRNGQLDLPFALLRKPFSRTDLATKVRTLLDQRITSVETLLG